MTRCVKVSHIDMTSLNQNELEALRILWERGELKPAEIQARFSWPIENATLRSVLVNLVGKRHITRRLQGKAFFYAARVPKATLLQTTMDALARIFAGGSHQELVVQLMETSDIKPADLKLVRQTAAGLSSKKTKRKSK
jgi:BlaI family transcriptional regulator, penicillinase repressor